MQSVIIFFGGFVLSAVAWIGLVAGQLGTLLPSSVWVDSVYEVKFARAKQLVSPKLVFIGGSSLLFGLDSDYLEEKLGFPVLNMGVNAGMPLQMIVGRGISTLNSGDVAVFVLEYPLYSENRDFTAGHIDFLLSHPHELASFPMPDKMRILLATPWKRLWQGYLGLPGGFDLSRNLYGAHNVDRYGDQIHTSLASRQPWMDEAIAASRLKHYGRDFIEDARGVRLLSAVAKELESRGVCVLFLPPPMLTQDAYVNDAVEQAYYKNLPAYLETYGLKMLKTPHAYMYPKEYFFDTPFHLVDERRREHTAGLYSVLADAGRIACDEV